MGRFLAGVMHAAHSRQVEVADGYLVILVFLQRLSQRIDLSLVSLFCKGGAEGHAETGKTQPSDEGTTGRFCKSHRVSSRFLINACLRTRTVIGGAATLGTLS